MRAARFKTATTLYLFMKYASIDDLPGSIREQLPATAQEVFATAYNTAWDAYEDPGTRPHHMSREQLANQAAWNAVKERYERDPSTGQWNKKGGQP